MNGSPGGPGAPCGGQKGQIVATQRRVGTCLRQIRRLTFSRTGCDVGLHLGTVGERLGPDTEVVGDAVCQVFDLHPQGGAALHIYRHNLTDTWSARRGVCAQNTKTLDAAFHKRQAEICAGEQTDNTLKFRQTIRDTHTSLQNKQKRTITAPLEGENFSISPLFTDLLGSVSGGFYS